MDEKIHHYEKKILKIETEENYSYCLAKLSKLPITVKELKNTRILQNVKRIVKKTPDSEAGLEAQKLLKRWNAILSAHDSLKEQRKDKSSDESAKSSKSSRTSVESTKESSKSNRTSLLDSSTYGGSWNSAEADVRPLDELLSENISVTESYTEPGPGLDEKSTENGFHDVVSEKKNEKKEKEKSSEKSHRKEEKRKSDKDSKRSESSHKSSHSKENKQVEKDDCEKKSREKDHENGHHSSKSKRKAEVKEVDLFGEGPTKQKRSKHSESPVKHKKDDGKSAKTTKTNEGIAHPSVSTEELKSSILESIETVPYYAIDQPSTSFKQFDPLPPPVRPKIVQKAKENNVAGLELMLSQKGKIGKVFSGKKSVSNQPIPTLLKLCQHVLEVNLDMLEYTGGIPFELLKPVLEKASADQLNQIEQYNPYLLEDTDYLWKAICHQHFRKEKPQEYETWRDVYFRCFDEREAKFANLTSKISSKVRQAVPVRQTKLAFVEPLPSNSSVRFAPSNVKKVGSMGAAKAKQIEANSQQAEARVRASGREAPPRPRTSASVAAIVAPKKAPLMQKTLMLMKNRFKR